MASATGRPERVVKLSQIGISGLLLNWVDYLDGMHRWRRDVMPLLEQAGLRRPFAPPPA